MIKLKSISNLYLAILAIVIGCLGLLVTVPNAVKGVETRLPDVWAFPAALGLVLTPILFAALSVFLARSSKAVKVGLMTIPVGKPVALVTLIIAITCGYAEYYINHTSAGDSVVLAQKALEDRQANWDAAEKLEHQYSAELSKLTDDVKFVNVLSRQLALDADSVSAENIKLAQVIFQSYGFYKCSECEVDGIYKGRTSEAFAFFSSKAEGIRADLQKKFDEAQANSSGTRPEGLDVATSEAFAQYFALVASLLTALAFTLGEIFLSLAFTRKTQEDAIEYRNAATLAEEALGLMVGGTATRSSRENCKMRIQTALQSDK